MVAERNARTEEKRLTRKPVSVNEELLGQNCTKHREKRNNQQAHHERMLVGIGIGSKFLEPYIL